MFKRRVRLQNTQGCGCWNKQDKEQGIVPGNREGCKDPGNHEGCEDPVVPGSGTNGMTLMIKGGRMF